jgi:hypothetical protein
MEDELNSWNPTNMLCKVWRSKQFLKVELIRIKSVDANSASIS